MTGSPCFMCGVNAWTSCKHRKAEREAPVVKREKSLSISGGGCYKIPAHRLKELSV